MSLLIFVVIVLVIVGLLVYAVDYLPFLDSRFANFVKLLLIIIAVVIIAQRAGVV